MTFDLFSRLVKDVMLKENDFFVLFTQSHKGYRSYIPDLMDILVNLNELESFISLCTGRAISCPQVWSKGKGTPHL